MSFEERIANALERIADALEKKSAGDMQPQLVISKEKLKRLIEGQPLSDDVIVHITFDDENQK